MAAPAPFPSAALRAWYEVHGRHGLPWRLTRDPYRVLVSEFMLQQTQVVRVLPMYAAWVDRWPSAHDLAGALRADVIRAWGGLGYNRRAVRLHEAAAAFDRDGGRVPLGVDALQARPGIGPYTARAVACFAGNARVPLLEANTKRVLARHRLGCEVAAGIRPRLLEAAATDALPEAGARDHNLALMDLGALVCRAVRPVCDSCPAEEGCAWRAAGSPTTVLRARRPSPRFEDTARYARGRIVAALRRRDALSTAEVEATLPEAHRVRARDHLAALCEEGLVEPDGERWSLAGGCLLRG